MLFAIGVRVVIRQHWCLYACVCLQLCVHILFNKCVFPKFAKAVFPLIEQKWVNCDCEKSDNLFAKTIN